MTGAEHYKEAERLLDTQAPPLIAKAQVHATLALAAATAGARPGAPALWDEWLEVIS